MTLGYTRSDSLGVEKSMVKVTGLITLTLTITITITITITGS